MREEYGRLSRNVHRRKKHYLKLWRNKLLTGEAKSLDKMIEILRAANQSEAASGVETMGLDGVTLEPADADDRFYLVTTDPEVAKKYGMEDEAEFWNEDDDPE